MSHRLAGNFRKFAQEKLTFLCRAESRAEFASSMALGALSMPLTLKPSFSLR